MALNPISSTQLGIPAPPFPKDGTSPHIGRVEVPGQPVTPSEPTANPELLAEPPEGTDAKLWSVLTSEERAYFARIKSASPLTYGRRRDHASLSGTLGGRFDVRV